MPRTPATGGLALRGVAARFRALDGDQLARGVPELAGGGGVWSVAGGGVWDSIGGGMLAGSDGGGGALGSLAGGIALGSAGGGTVSVAGGAVSTGVIVSSSVVLLQAPSDSTVPSRAAPSQAALRGM
jgi:hypothetical protein